MLRSPLIYQILNIMMTQRLTKQQGSNEQPCQKSSGRGKQQFNALSQKTKRDEEFQKVQNSYTQYEIDSVKECFGELFRVWNRKDVIRNVL